MIEAFRVGVVSRGRTLWEGITLAVGDGEIWVGTGPSSCGKTTLMQILRGEREPDFGDVVVAGESLYRGSPGHNLRFRASSGVVPESFPGSAGKTVEEMFVLSALAAGGVGVAERKGRMEELLSMVGLSGAQAEAVSSLSASERARAALAVELFRGPRYLFLDMLLANAGKEWEERLGALLRALGREERTIVMMERHLPEKWVGMTISAPLNAEPFTFHRLGGGTSAERKAEGDPMPPGGRLPMEGGAD
ncbi:MAG TPA: ATP-binding cassette domain-containing protein [Candidatus Deferrimicrobiaceae bacterium]|nr:ATP-binding cassette domain-containing protein [Candidatus Deferrimicrobiaceae bacterium]